MFVIYDGATEFEQWEQGKMLTNEHMGAGDRVFFSNAAGKAIPVNAKMKDGTVIVDVPNGLLMMSKNLIVDLEGRPSCRTMFKVNACDRPNGYVEINNIPDEPHAGGSSVQSDLSANDESDPAFVKGRTHYVTDKLTITGEPNNTYSYSMEVPVSPEFNESDTVTVIWDGTEYEVTAVATSSGVYVGNWMFKSYMSSDTGHPFLWYYGNKSDGTAFSTVYANDNKTHTIQIKDKVFSVSLDKKFLPRDTIFKKDLADSMKPLSVKVSLGSISSGTISNITLDKTFDEIKKAYDKNREIRFYKNNNQSSYRDYETFTPDYIISNYNEFLGFYLRRIEYSGGNIYFYNVKIHNGYTYSGSRYTLSKA